MSTFYYGNPVKTDSWEQAASIFAAHDSVNSEKTSSLPLVQFWRPSGSGMNERIRRFFQECELPPEGFVDGRYCFEYAVPINKEIGGVGKSSMTDLMIITEDHAVAVEAKWTECRQGYEPIKKWKENGKKGNREDVLHGWVAYINNFLGDDRVNVDRLDDFPYQMLHRIASACKVATNGEKKRSAVVVYHLFHAKDSAEDRKSMDNFSAYITKQYKDLGLGADEVSFCIVATSVVFNVPQKIAELSKLDKKYLNDIFIAMQRDDIYMFGETKKLFHS